MPGRNSHLTHALDPIQSSSNFEDVKHLPAVTTNQVVKYPYSRPMKFTDRNAHQAYKDQQKIEYRLGNNQTIEHNNE